jgi:GT2 family glycosyltransferase
MTGSSHDTWVSVIIVCHNDGRWLPRCLESLRQQTLFVHLEIILVDNASQDGTDKLAQELIAGWDNARFIASGGDRGYCAGINLGAKVAKGRYLYLFNTDTWLEPDCLERLHKAAEAEGAAGAGSLILNYEDDSVQAKGSNGFDLFGSPVSPRGGRDPEVLFCIAGFYFIRREVFFELGMLDERLFMYGEEMDLSWRIWLSGRKIIPVMEARVHHRGAAGVNPAGGNRVVENRTSTQKRFLANRNRLLTIAKNAQHVLLLLLLPTAGLVLLEALVTLVMSRSWSLAQATCFAALTDCWRLRGHVSEQRRRVKGVRKRGDFWLLRFFRFGFGRSHEVMDILRRGFPKIVR